MRYNSEFKDLKNFLNYKMYLKLKKSLNDNKKSWCKKICNNNVYTYKCIPEGVIIRNITIFYARALFIPKNEFNDSYIDLIGIIENEK